MCRRQQLAKVYLHRHVYLLVWSTVNILCIILDAYCSKWSQSTLLLLKFKWSQSTLLLMKFKWSQSTLLLLKFMNLSDSFYLLLYLPKHDWVRLGISHLLCMWFITSPLVTWVVNIVVMRDRSVVLTDSKCTVTNVYCTYRSILVHFTVHTVCHGVCFTTYLFWCILLLKRCTMEYV